MQNVISVDMHNVQHNPTMMRSIRRAPYSPPPMTAITQPGTLRRSDTVNITSTYGSMKWTYGYDTRGEAGGISRILCQLVSPFNKLDSNVIQCIAMAFSHFNHIMTSKNIGIRNLEMSFPKNGQKSSSTYSDETIFYNSSFDL